MDKFKVLQGASHKCKGVVFLWDLDLENIPGLTSSSWSKRGNPALDGPLAVGPTL